MFYSTLVAFSLLATQQLVAGHGAIVNAVGDAGGQGSAIGVNPSTPRDGTGREPFQQDSTRFRGDAAASCGETLGGGTNNVETGTREVMAQNGDTLPQITPGGEIQMTVHQVNADGAGPYTCMIDATGTGTNWQNIQVTQNLPGNERGRNRETNETPQPLTAAIPAGQECTGTVAGQENVCMVRCQNPARAGPFGGCVPVQMAGNATAAGAAAGNANANANGNANNNANANNANANGNANNNANANNANGNANNNNANANNNGNGNANNAASNNRANNNNAANNNNNNAAADEDAAGANDRKLRRSAKFLFDRQSRKLDTPLQPFEIEEEAEELDEE